jgi:Cu2+-exporting ATPase
LSQVNAVVFDKTGTLTSDEMRLQAMFTPQGKWDAHHMPTGQALEHLQLAAHLAQHSSHPYARAVMKLASQPWVELTLEEVQEHVGQGLSAIGRSPDGSTTRAFRLGSLAFCQDWQPGCLVPVQALGAQVHVCDEHSWLASFSFEETVRLDALPTMDMLRSLGMAVYLMSGDKPPAVARVGDVLGLPASHLYASCSPQDKLSHLQSLQAQGWRVAMVGDGFNDMPVLAGAHVSFAFGQAVPLAQARSDVVVQGQRLQAIADTVALAQRTQVVVRHNLVWAALYNAVCVPLAFMGYLPPWLAGLGMALSSLWVVLYSLQLSLPTHPQSMTTEVA